MSEEGALTALAEELAERLGGDCMSGKVTAVSAKAYCSCSVRRCGPLEGRKWQLAWQMEVEVGV
jgi:hypothetical protein